MKAIRVHAFGEANVLQCDDVSNLTPNQDQILIRIKAIGINPVDAYIRSGQYPTKPTLPYTPGSDCSGTIEAVGTLIKTMSPGQRVYTWGSVSGTYAEYCLCTLEQVHPLPDTLSFEQGAALGIPFATAYHALIHKAHAKAGQTVLIHGASGGVGTAAIQLARSLGLTVLATAGSQAGLTLISHLGAHHVLNHYDTHRDSQIMAMTQSRGVDVILEMLANENLATDLELLAMQGIVVVIGNRGFVEINPRLLMAKDASVCGMILAHTTSEQKQSISEGIHAGLTNGTLSPVTGETFTLEHASHAHEHVISGSHHGKILLIP